MIRNIGYVVLLVEGIIDAITTYISLSLGFPEQNIFMRFIYDTWGKEALSLVLLWWAFYRIRILKNMHKEGLHRVADITLICALAYSGYIMLHNLGGLYLCLEFKYCLLP